MALVKGTLDLLILRTLEVESLYGVAISERIRRVTNGAFAVPPGSLFPALYRIEEQGWIRIKRKQAAQGGRCREYEITRAGRLQLAIEWARWDAVVDAIHRIREQH